MNYIYPKIDSLSLSARLCGVRQFTRSVAIDRVEIYFKPNIVGVVEPGVRREAV